MCGRKHLKKNQQPLLMCSGSRYRPGRAAGLKFSLLVSRAHALAHFLSRCAPAFVLSQETAKGLIYILPTL